MDVRGLMHGDKVCKWGVANDFKMERYCIIYCSITSKASWLDMEGMIIVLIPVA
jgi:hypothetical protein